MNDKDLIQYCADKAESAKPLFAAWRVERMIKAAGNPKAFANFIDGRQFYMMAVEMQALVELAKKRAARPAGGLPIKAGHAYRDVNGEVRKVTDMPPHGRTRTVLWIGANDKGESRLEDFQDWALEEVQP